MPLTPPTVGASYDQTEMNTALAAVTAFTNTNNVADAAAKAAMIAWITAIQEAVENEIRHHSDGRNLYVLKNAFTAVLASLA